MSTRFLFYIRIRVPLCTRLRTEKNKKLMKILLLGAWIVTNKKFNQFLLLGKPIGLVGVFIKQFFNE